MEWPARLPPVGGGGCVILFLSFKLLKAKALGGEIKCTLSTTSSLFQWEDTASVRLFLQVFPFFLITKSVSHWS